MLLAQFTPSTSPLPFSATYFFTGKRGRERRGWLAENEKIKNTYKERENVNVKKGKKIREKMYRMAGNKI